MGTAFAIVWALALLAIAVLLVTLARLLRRAPGTSTPGDEPAELRLAHDTLLFYYEEDGVRSTADGRVIVHIPGAAWDAGWREDLLRLEVIEQPHGLVTFLEELGPADALAVYDLAAYRMTEMGTDVAVERFPAPIDVILTGDRMDGQLGVVMRTEHAWVLAPPADVAPRALEGIELPAGRVWVATALVRPSRICLVRMHNERRAAEDTPS